MRSTSSSGRKHGVSLWRNWGATPLRSVTSARKRSYFAADHCRLNACRSEDIKEEFSVAHDLPPIDPNIELSPHHVDVRCRIPVGAGVRSVGIAERDVDAGNLLVLQDVADYVTHPDIGADGKLA